MDDIRNISDRDLERFLCNAYDRMKRDMAGGDRYGVDWSTLRIVSPGWYNSLKRLSNEIKRRVDLGQFV